MATNPLTLKSEAGIYSSDSDQQFEKEMVATPPTIVLLLYVETKDFET
jgi:hypothetical protein